MTAESDQSWVHPVGLFGLLTVFLFMTSHIGNAVMNRVIWYQHRPADLKDGKLWVIWIFMDVMVGICLVTIPLQIQDFSDPSNKIAHSPFVIFCMIAVTQILEKLFVPLCRLIDTKVSKTNRMREYTEKERLEILMKDVNTEAYYRPIEHKIKWSLSLFSILLFASALVTLILIGIDYTGNASYKLVISLWSMVTLLCMIGMIATCDYFIGWKLFVQYVGDNKLSSV